MNVEEFWKEKEKETNSKLIIKTVAYYKSGYPGLTEPVNGGLLYLMMNGFYFENFKNIHYLENILFKKKEFKKISFHIPLEKVTNVYDGFGNKKQVKKTFKNRVKYFFSKKRNEDLNIEYKSEEGENTVITFSILMDPIIFCEEYYKLV